MKINEEELSLNLVMCCGKKKCPRVNIHQKLDKVILGGEKEGYSSWEKEQFKMLVREAKKGTFDEYL